MSRVGFNPSFRAPMNATGKGIIHGTEPCCCGGETCPCTQCGGTTGPVAWDAVISGITPCEGDPFTGPTVDDDTACLECEVETGPCCQWGGLADGGGPIPVALRKSATEMGLMIGCSGYIGNFFPPWPPFATAFHFFAKISKSACTETTFTNEMPTPCAPMSVERSLCGVTYTSTAGCGSGGSVTVTPRSTACPI